MTVRAGSSAPLLFIDTNVFLSFFHFAKDDLEELRKLSALLKRNELTVLLPVQVIDEFWRNRDNKIADMLRKVRENEPRRNYPRLFQEYPELEKLNDIAGDAESLHTSLMRRAEKDAIDRTFAADAVIAELFDRARTIDIRSEYIEDAQRRRDLGSPPGKRDSIGDAVNWEALLDGTPKGEDLHFVSEDGDWQSPLSAGLFNSYLLDEWRKRKDSEIVFYPLLSGFFKKQFPDIKIAADVEVRAAIDALANSGSFADTHAAVASLSAVPLVNKDHLNAIVNACLSNDQVRRILHDADVKGFIEQLIKGRTKEIDATALGTLTQKLKSSEEDVFWERA